MQGHLNVLREMYFPDADFTSPLLRFSRRMFRRGGSYDPETGDIAVALGLWIEYGVDEVIDVVKHELIHAHVITEERSHGPTFLIEAARIGCNLFCPEFAVDRRRTSNKRFVYACPTCRYRVVRRRRAHLSCGTCNPVGYDEAFALVLAERIILHAST